VCNCYIHLYDMPKPQRYHIYYWKLLTLTIYEIIVNNKNMTCTGFTSP
jgi:hypothetical protein